MSQASTSISPWNQVGEHLIVKEDTITNNNKNLYQTAYHTQCFNYDSYHNATIEWTIEIILKRVFIGIGVTSVMSFKDSYFWDIDEINPNNKNSCYVYATSAMGKPMITSHETGVQWIDWGEKFETGDVIMVRLNFRNRTLEFYKNNQLITNKPAFTNIVIDNNIGYRLAVSTMGDGDSVKFKSVLIAAQEINTGGRCVCL